MGNDGFVDSDQATEWVRSAMIAVTNMRNGDFWRIKGDDLLAFGQELETLARTVYAVNVHLAGEVEKQGLAKERGASSTAALLRQSLLISAPEAWGRVKTAQAVLPQEILTGGDLPPVLPALGAALDAGAVGTEHIRTIVATMGKLPDALPAEDRDLWESFLVDQAAKLDPKQLQVVAAAVLDAADPDGTLDESDAKSKMEFTIGSRNARTGLTGIKGHLDDHGIDVVRKAITALSAPKPVDDCTPDPRPSANRRAHALVEALEGFLAAGAGPSHGGEKPQVVIYLHWDQLHDQISKATSESGFAMTTGQARRYLCDANIIPIVLGADSEILDVGRARRTYTRGMRRAIKARDRGCIWDGCDRPANWCDVHHSNWWARDLGETNVETGVLLCSFHHDEIHKAEWVIRFAEDGRPELIPPPWIDRSQRPRRNEMHHLRDLVEG
ncbi:HNH endonuclease signature motif containing protein [Nakamurella sp. PAMC28650]|uniref:HNH endonuclease signature motif containing protein n=1 Tax=Nakamurella sp. PAMC28650 TaxID=2762325 RepID=UPI00164DDBEB|nr:HNH endonuclease signature motif containing protein [Nakamurella sp. PAMC28650]QNK81318.1 DUF222 domain-containing protein [Nakamurella sp. PAMC28650]